MEGSAIVESGDDAAVTNPHVNILQLGIDMLRLIIYSLPVVSAIQFLRTCKKLYGKFRNDPYIKRWYDCSTKYCMDRLVAAAEYGDLSLVRAFHCNQPCSYVYYIAARRGHEHVVSYLIDKSRFSYYPQYADAIQLAAYGRSVRAGIKMVAIDNSLLRGFFTYGDIEPLRDELMIYAEVMLVDITRSVVLNNHIHLLKWLVNAPRSRLSIAFSICHILREILPIGNTNALDIILEAYADIIYNLSSACKYELCIIALIGNNAGVLEWLREKGLMVKKARLKQWLHRRLPRGREEKHRLWTIIGKCRYCELGTCIHDGAK